GRVLALVVVANVITAAVSLGIGAALGFVPGLVGAWIAGTVAGAIAAPYEAHVLTVLYYRLTEPERPILPPETAQEGWKSVWDEEQP
ncbi:MAG: hypothetical protein ACRDL2_07635, partial [Gaiellaceae bacterium]